LFDKPVSKQEAAFAGRYSVYVLGD